MIPTGDPMATKDSPQITYDHIRAARSLQHSGLPIITLSYILRVDAQALSDKLHTSNLVRQENDDTN